MNILEHKLSLVDLDTPLALLENITQGIGKGNLYIKRDDLLGHGLGGNKIRKLEYLLKEAEDQQVTRIITMGGIQSNHARLTASVCAKLGYPCSLILKGDRPESLTGNLLLDALLGAEIHYMPELEKDNLKHIYDNYVSQGDRLYVIPTGGSTPTGVLGYINMMRELKEQMQGKDIKHLVLAAGSYGTMAGVILGNALFEMGLTVWGIDVVGRKEGLSQLEGLIEDTIETYQLDVTIKDPYQLLFDYVGPGYNSDHYDSRKYISLMARKEGIFLDPCYTAKSFYGFIDLVETSVISDDENALFLHTGGSPILFSQEHRPAFEKELIY